jgi:hypothetical protein
MLICVVKSPASGNLVVARGWKHALCAVRRVCCSFIDASGVLVCQAMLAPISPLIGLVLGFFFAWAGRVPNARSGLALSSRALLVVISFSLLVFAPICSYFLAFAPDWSYAYLVDSERLPSTVDLTLVLVNAASVPAGFLVGSHHIRARPSSSIARVAFLPAVLTLLFIAVTVRRLGVDASYAQYHGDFGTRSLAGSPLGYAVLWMLVVLAGAAAWTAHSLRRLAAHE